MIDDPCKSAQRIAVFCDWEHWVPQCLLVEFIGALAKHRGSQSLVAVCVPKQYSHRTMLYRYIVARVKGCLRALLYLDTSICESTPRPVNLQALARRHGFIVLSANKRDTNDPSFLAQLDELANANVVLSLFWKSKFSSDFIEHFDQAVNYHNGSVPAYRGLLATAWSLYNRETHSGFTFHRMDAGLDLGNVLIAGEIPITERHTRLQLEIDKTRRACECMKKLLKKIATNDPGEAQSDLKRYNHLAAAHSLIHPEQLDGMSGIELRRRIRAFGSVSVPWKDSRIEIKRLHQVTSRSFLSTFREVKLKDGQWRIAWFDWLRWRIRQHSTISER